MPVLYDGQKIIPAPFVNIRKEYTMSEAGETIGSRFVLTLTGKLFPCKGSPTSSGTFWTDTGYPTDETDADAFESLLTKTGALRSLFAQQGRAFEIQAFTGAEPIKCYPKVNNINFAEGNWVIYVDYTVELEAYELFGPAGFDTEDFANENNYFVDSEGNRLFLRDVSEDWSLETMEEPEGLNLSLTYRLVHNVNAAGLKAYDGDGSLGEAWEQARRWVDSRIGYSVDFALATSGIGLPGYYSGYNHVRTENVDKAGGTYGIQEAWVLTSGNYIEDFTVNVTTSIENGLTSVGVDGMIRGLESRSPTLYQNVTQTKWSAAKARWDVISAGSPTYIYNRALSYGAPNLNIMPNNTTVGFNPIAGTITYGYNFDTRPPNCIEEALSENIEIIDTNAHNVFAIIPVLGRSAGPVLQDIGTVTEVSRTVNIDVIVPPPTGCPTTPSGANSLIASSPKNSVNVLITGFYDALAASYTQVFKSDDTERWNPKTGNYSRSVTWVYQNCGDL